MSPTAVLPVLPPHTATNMNVEELFSLLEQQQARKLDLVVPAHRIRTENGYLRIQDITADDLPPATIEQLITVDGVADLNGLYLPNASADADLAEKFKIPVSYLRRCRTENLALYDANLNSWTHQDNRRVLIRAMWGGDPHAPSSKGIVRAVLSDEYQIGDHHDRALSFLEGMQLAGLGANNIRAAHLSENRLYIDVEAPQIEVMAYDLLKDYRSPFTGESGLDCPVVYSGLLFSNSETGHGRTVITPKIIVKVCGNGVTLNAAAKAKRHQGGRLDEGLVDYARDTRAADAKARSFEVRDTVRTFLSTQFLSRQVEEISKIAQVQLSKPSDTIDVVQQRLGFSKSERDGILDHFIRGADSKAGGVLHAVTSFAQTIAESDIDRSFDLEAQAIPAMRIAAAGR